MVAPAVHVVADAKFKEVFEMKRKMTGCIAAVIVAAMLMTGCGSDGDKTQQTASKETIDVSEETASDVLESTEIQVFVANSLNDAVLELADAYNATQPNVTVVPNALGSQELRQQIESGSACDLFISANMKQMKMLDENSDQDYVVDDSVVKLLTNELVLITGKDSGTEVTDFESIPKCQGSFALAGEEVPVGNYSRQAFEKLGITEDVFELSIDEKTKVGDVRKAVAEGMAEIGTVYKSDAYQSIDRLEILDTADPSWFESPIVYPMALIHNEKADADEKAAAEDFYEFLQSEEAAKIFEKYMFVMYKE